MNWEPESFFVMSAIAVAIYSQIFFSESTGQRFRKLKAWQKDPQLIGTIFTSWDRATCWGNPRKMRRRLGRPMVLSAKGRTLALFQLGKVCNSSSLCVQAFDFPCSSMYSKLAQALLIVKMLVCFLCPSRVWNKIWRPAFLAASSRSSGGWREIGNRRESDFLLSCIFSLSCQTILKLSFISKNNSMFAFEAVAFYWALGCWARDPDAVTFACQKRCMMKRCRLWV